MGFFLNPHANIVPYQTFRAANGYIVIAIGNDGQFAKLCELLPAPELAGDPRYATNQARVANRAELVPILQEYFSRHTAGHWTDLLIGAGLPCGPINTVDQVFTDPQVLARKMVQRIAHPTAGEIGAVGVPFTFSETPAGIDRPPPLLSQHSSEVLSDLGYSSEEIARFRAEGVI
ncbi:MAG: CaiB/BaiF CoA transferase family protein [Chloroflexota bacterium]